MHALLYIGEEIIIEENIKAFLIKENLKRIDFPLTTIKEVKDLISLIRIPFSTKTAVIIKNFENASIEAQNSLLKHLEEPQKKLFFILSTANEEKVLATILSRSTKIYLGDKLKPSDKTTESVKTFLGFSLGEKLKKISYISDRDSAKVFLSEIIKVIRITEPENILIAEKADETLQRINANANVQLQLTHFVLSL